MRSKLLRYTAIAVVGAGLLSACQTTGSNKYGYDYSADVCKVQRDRLLEQQDYFAEDLIKGVVGGAAVGALAGVLGAAITGGDIGEGAAIGAISGAVAGAGAAYFNHVLKESGNQSRLLSTILLDMESDAERLARTQRALDALIACRRGEAQTIRANVRAGTIDAATGRTQMATLNKKLREDLRVAREINGNVAERRTEFRVAAVQVGAVPGSRPPPRTSVSSAPPAAATAARPTVQVTAENKPTQAKIGQTYTTLEKRSVAVDSKVTELASLEQSTAGDGGFSTSWLPGAPAISLAVTPMPAKVGACGVCSGS
ncbi:hypothetical protein [Roseospira visakhapatnamensis]|uniref:Outer membrane lipoprotein SlyB n=1 Tax=Roseospira visakhapatnamensis TaxID=390880 RepID=A0A7W6RF87_9PROT|nr:hypothetical protein [Roseospira visakhapatnamensis]MBB4267445.1 outer membrane lipoprotein SlyB [Roseospira visakhapatnamensis]